jgi:type IV pilus assembly protein PilW
MIQESRFIGSKKGFTLVELMVSIAIGAIVLTSVISYYFLQQRSSGVAREVAMMQQQLRGAFYTIDDDIRLAGYNPEGSNEFSDVIDVRRYGRHEDAWGDTFSALLTIAYDWSADSPATRGNGIRDEPRYTYGLFDLTRNGVTDLVRVEDIDFPGRQLQHVQLVAENIEALGFAYAYANGIGNDVATGAGGNPIWAVDTNNDNRLDSGLNPDGTTFALGEAVEANRIRMARIWLLVRSKRNTPSLARQQTYVIGDQVIVRNDGFRRRLLERQIEFFNMGI